MIAAVVPLEAVPAELLAAAPFQSSAGWWRCVIAAGLPPDTTPHLLLAHDSHRPVGLLPLCCGSAGLAGLVTPYTSLFQPVIAPGVDPIRLGEAFGRACVAWPVMRLEALDAYWAGWPDLLAGFAAAGWRTARFDSFGNWYTEAAAGWEAYVDARPGALRTTIRRKLRRAERDAAQSFSLIRAHADAIAAVAAYEAVYRQSWKPAEPFAAFGPAVIAEAAAAGVLRLGLLHRDGIPMAAQYWTVEGHAATVHKLAHDEAAKAFSPGTVLTAWMVRGLLAEGVTELDFGRGDDPYKRHWADARRQRHGFLLARPWRPHGAAALARQALGRLRRTARGPGWCSTQPEALPVNIGPFII